MGADLESNFDRIGGQSPLEVEAQAQAQKRKQALQEARRVLKSRQDALRRILAKPGEDNRILWEFLTRFCRADRSTFHEDPRMHAVLEGRREVFLILRKHLDLPFEDLWVLLNNGQGE